MERLENPIAPYAWGSHTAIAALLGRPRSEGPQAELWLGAHPSNPSRVSGGRTLEQLISEDPPARLGADVAQRFGGKLPFLLKVLAAEKPLSLQAHPSPAQAREGFAREQAAGVPLDAPQRLYRDQSHKPELLCALTDFDALCGFRPVERTLELFDGLRVAELAVHAHLLRPQLAGPSGLSAFFARVMTLESGRRRELAKAVVEACANRPVAGFEAECAWAVKLGAAYPGDAGVVGALSLNLVHLKPLEALYLPAGVLHAYLHGTGIELMASSDNVLRGGLTPKHVDVAELQRVLRFEAAEAEVLHASGAPEAVFSTPAPEFRLSRIALTRPTSLGRLGPDILLCTEGAVRVNGLELPQGGSVFVAANEGPLALEGSGVVFRATVNA